MERQEGYYWCYFDYQTGWVIGEWGGEYWTVHHSENEYKDSDFTEIDERRIVRGEVRPSPEELAKKTEELRISQSMGDHINDVDDLK